jgi:hypothetical protein
VLLLVAELQGFSSTADRAPPCTLWQASCSELETSRRERDFVGIKSCYNSKVVTLQTSGALLRCALRHRAIAQAVLLIGDSNVCGFLLALDVIQLCG